MRQIMLYIVLFAQLIVRSANAQSHRLLLLPSHSCIEQSTHHSIIFYQNVSSNVFVNPVNIVKSATINNISSSAIYHNNFATSNSIYSSQIISTVSPAHVTDLFITTYDDNPFGNETVEDTKNPQEPGAPLGNIPLPLVILSIVLWCLRISIKQ